MKRARLIIIVVVLALFSALAVSLYCGREPRYQGRSLSDWIGDFEMRPDDDSQWQTTSNAVRQIGPAAIPFLLRWVRASDSAPKKKMIVWLQDHPSLRLQIKSSFEYHAMARLGFAMLGNDARPAWPDLIRLTSTPDPLQRQWAILCLQVTNPDKKTMLPALKRLVHDPDDGVRGAASNFLSVLYPEVMSFTK